MTEDEAMRSRLVHRLMSMSMLMSDLAEAADKGTPIEELLEMIEEDLTAEETTLSPTERSVFDGCLIAIKNIIKFSEHS